MDLFSVAGKVVLVTGGSAGIGRMIATGFVEAGAKVYISSRKAEVCDATAAQLSEAGTCISIPADLSTEDGANGLAAAIAEREPSLDVLVNNAGAAWGAPLEDFPDSGWDKVMALNVKAVFHLTRALLPQLEAAGSAEDPARVINVGSVDGIRVPEGDNFSYTASKAAVHQLTRMLAKKLARRHITVNVLAPGAVNTKMMAATIDAFGDDIIRRTPLRRLGTPEDMAGAAIYLAARSGAWVTGAIIPVDGGIWTTL